MRKLGEMPREGINEKDVKENRAKLLLKANGNQVSQQINMN